MNIFKTIVATSLLSATILLPNVVSADTTSSTNLDVIVPAYSYPSKGSTYWSTMQDNASTIAYTILNQSDGDFTRLDSNYQRLFKENTEKGLNNLAYVHLEYGERSVDEITKNIDTYISLYGLENIKGFFLDETETRTETGRAQLKYLRDYIKSIKSDLVVVSNRGTSVTDDAKDLADIFCTYESDESHYLNNYRKTISSWELDPQNKGKIMHIIYGVSQENYDKVIELAKERNVGYIFITSDGNDSENHKTIDNVFDELPNGFVNLLSKLHVESTESTQESTESTNKTSESSDESKAENVETNMETTQKSTELSTENTESSTESTNKISESSDESKVETTETSTKDASSDNKK